MKIYQMILYISKEENSRKLIEFIINNPECHDVVRYLSNKNINTGMNYLNIGTYIKPNNSIDCDILSDELIDYFSECGSDNYNGDRAKKENFAIGIYHRGEDNQYWKWFVELIATHGHNSEFWVGYQKIKHCLKNGNFTIGYLKNLKARWCDRLNDLQSIVKKELDAYSIRYQMHIPVGNAKYLLDFYLPEYNLVIMCNDSYIGNLPEKRMHDKLLEQRLNEKGKTVLWLWKTTIENEDFSIKNYIEVD